MGNVNKIFGLEHNPGARIMPKCFGLDHTPDQIKTSAYVEPNGSTAQAAFKFDLLHREDGPAWIDEWSVEYYEFGYQHRAIAPAVVGWQSIMGNKFLKKQEYHFFDNLHRDDDRPAVIFYNIGGEVQGNAFYKFDELHRDKGPARIKRNSQGDKESEEYYQFGSLHSEDGPAMILTDPLDVEMSEHYHKFNLKHRDDGPAHIIKDVDDNITRQTYYKMDCLHSEIDVITKLSQSSDSQCSQYYRFDQLHRLSGPAEISSEDSCIIEKYYKLSYRTRLDGPAFIEYTTDVDNPKRSHKFYIAGKEISEEEFYEMTLDERKQLEIEGFKKIIRIRLIHDFNKEVITSLVSNINYTRIGIKNIIDIPDENSEIVIEDDYETIKISYEALEPNGFTSKTFWKFKGLKLHCDNGPAYRKILFDRDGNEFKRTEIWAQFGKCHRWGNRPAISISDKLSTTTMYCRFGYLHRDNGPALNTYTECTTRSEHYRFGHLHKDNGPAIIEHKYGGNDDEIIYSLEVFYQFSKKHRPGGPAEIIKDSTSSVNVETEIFYQYDLIHHDEKPAITSVRKNSNNDIIYEENYWKQFGYMHRDNGPASTVIRYSGSKKITHEKFYQFDEIHRNDGPAEIIEINDGIREKRIAIFKKFSKIHRDFGPAILNSAKDRVQPIYLMGVKITEANVLEHLPDIIKYCDTLGESISPEIKNLIPKNQEEEIL